MDAIGSAIEKIKNAEKHTAEDYRAEKVMFVIITDGEENSSREYSYEDIKGKIETQKTKCGWEFIFLGANIDAVGAASRVGISANRAQNFHADEKGVQMNFQVMAEAVSAFRKSSAVPEDWNEAIEKDYKGR